MRLVFGVDYYPEYWPRSRWDRDAELMAELSFNVVRLAEFSWSRLEPRDGVYDFGWLDEAIDILAKKGMKVILGTPTAAPPPWLVRRYPDILRMDPNGVRSPAGTRRNYCPNNPSYIMYTRRIVERMASHYRDNPYVIGWQIDNEFGIDPCYCDNCVEAFRDWLRGRYRDIEVLNRSWGSVFWSQEYGDWSEVQPPRPPLDMQNPSLCLDWHRFMSDSWVKYQKIQIEIIRRIASHHIVTHNLMGLYKELDYFKIAEPLDIVSFDYYPKRSLITDYARGAMAHDVMRSLKKKGYWVMELQSGAIKTSMAPIPKPGEIRLWTFQSVARGADGILYFTWRTCRFGAEEYWHGILDHDGIPRRRFFEVKKISEDLRRVAPYIEGTSVKPEIAFTLVYDSIWAWDLELTYGGRGYYGLSSWDPALDFYRALYSKNIAVDFADPSREDLSRYKVVFAPSLILMNEHIEDKLRGYVKDGGTLVATPRTGAKDWNNVIVDSTLPGGLSDVFGIHVEEYTGLPDDSRVYMEMNGAVTGGKIEMSGRCWAEMLSLRGADAIAYYKAGLYKDRPAITMNRYGKGIAIYIGSFLDTSSYMPFTDWLIRTLGIKPILPPLDGVEAIERISSDGRIRIIFVLNYNETPVRIHLVEECLDILAGERVQGEIEVNGLDVKVFKSLG
ncbi:MAG: beta-galactosidase [Nitrososphaerota archaeon]|nr:beta-galactosidase [Candidatus Bathyarchaeota archaeon]MDW8062173.1 beta-galactosidase [Nitrososphaerota archaeon]